MTAARRPARSDPANFQFFLLCMAAHNRKNYLFAGSDTGGESGATMYTLIGTTKLNGQILKPICSTSSAASERVNDFETPGFVSLTSKRVWSGW